MVLRRICSLWKLDVLVIALTPSSIASKPSACQSRQRVRSDLRRQKPPFAHRMYFSSQRHADLGVSSCSLLNPAHIVSHFRYFFCLHLLCHFRFPPFALRDNSFRFQAYTQHPSLFDFSNCQTYTVLNAYSSFSRASFRNKLPSSQSVALCLFFVICGLNDACADRQLVDLFF